MESWRVCLCLCFLSVCCAMAMDATRSYEQLEPMVPSASPNGQSSPPTSALPSSDSDKPKKKKKPDFIDVDCFKLPPKFMEACRNVTAVEQQCVGYSLVVERLCYRTCAALQGRRCDAVERNAICYRDPCCPAMCDVVFEEACEWDVPEHPPQTPAAPSSDSTATPTV
eukprot:GILK01009739.1.p1 GENE.GILK01009739.1~~GILK01009739.1.p1  ORF type:complete len:178 (+),score=14.20 GILK01009739.1:31-534(+)